MTIYDEMQTLATGLLQQFNQGVISLVKLTSGAGPSYNPGAASSVSTVLSGAVCRGVKAKYVMGGLALASDLQVTMPGTYNPTLSDFIVVDNVQYKIVNVISKPSAGVAAVHTVIIRK